ncbi:hypothetical protein [Noviherbaspirillum galbum]|uniref:Uncharacterized protein n=1 Tax=Noviherbaspirillum galbum TaxID=2709383 RepID=A0A6B3SMX1_9BURK|nr:hypothetical protein [Noviherbaspirillum galbum]NEX62220.1 hypothetical protein [Noviherbaspirillum galbum]
MSFPLSRFALAVSLALTLPPFALSRAQTDAQPDDGLEEPVRQFIEGFINPAQTPEQQVAYFADGVRYYRFGPTSKEEIVKDIRRTARRWPSRTYVLSRIEYIRKDPDSDDVFVSYVLDYEVANGPRSASGTASYGAIISGIHDQPKITMIMEKLGSASSGQ